MSIHRSCLFPSHNIPTWSSCMLFTSCRPFVTNIRGFSPLEMKFCHNGRHVSTELSVNVAKMIAILVIHSGLITRQFSTINDNNSWFGLQSNGLSIQRFWISALKVFLCRTSGNFDNAFFLVLPYPMMSWTSENIENIWGLRFKTQAGHKVQVQKLHKTINLRQSM